MVYNETGLEGFNMSFEMLSDLGIKNMKCVVMILGASLLVQ